MAKVAFLGPAGTFGEEAALLHNPLAQLMPMPSHSAVMDAVDKHMADEGIVPIENSIEGSVNDTLDLLIHESRLQIKSEVVVPINQCVLAKNGVESKDIAVIYSHPQALGQCRRFLERVFPKAQTLASLSTAAAVEDMKKSSVPAAAIASARAGELFGAAIIAKNVQDNPNNVTRFVVLAHTDAEPTGDDKTSIAFMFSEDKPGQLYGVLGEFAKRDINLAKIESRPSKEALGKYVFLVDLNGHRKDKTVMDTLEVVKTRSSMFKLFGSYPRRNFA